MKLETMRRGPVGLRVGLTLLWVGLSIGALTTRASSAAQEQEGRRTPPERLGEDDYCLDCHGGLAEGASVHEPVADEFCEACHTQPDPELHVLEPVTNLGARCGLCHDLVEETGHEPFATGECDSCHDPHRASRPFLLRGEDDGALCSACHADQSGEHAESVHGPVAVGACTACHAPHTSEHGKLLRSESYDLCLSCHDDFERRMEETEFLHAPVEADCTYCHDAHASDHPFQLRSGGNQLCLNCHQPLAESVAEGSSVHGALHTGDGCLNCHGAHGGAFSMLLERPVAEGCLQCHQAPVARADGSLLEGIGEKLAASSSHHGPIREGDCSGCHEPHATSVFSLLRKAYPQRFYAPYESDSYGLCFMCHEERVFLTPETTTLTGFRNGARNLHYVHVSKEKKGRTCRACHETHASSRPKHMSESVPFGEWRYPLNYEQTPTGGSCAPGCHTPQTYEHEAGV